MTARMPNAATIGIALILLVQSFVLAGAATTAASNDLHFTITALPGLPDMPMVGGDARSINDNGEITGAIQISESEWVAVAWIDGIAVDLGLEPFTYPTESGVASDGTVAGTRIFDESSPSGFSRDAFVWKSGVVSFLSAPPGYHDIQAFDLNDQGAIIGAADDDDKVPVGVVWEDGQFIVLGSVGDLAFYPSALNESGVIAGRIGLPGDDEAAAVWESGQIKLLAEPEDGYSAATDINETGLIVGWVFSQSDQMFHPAVWDSGQVTLLPTPDGFVGSMARAINDDDQIAGIATRSDVTLHYGIAMHPVLWRDGEAVDVWDLTENIDGWDFLEVSDMNDAGQIVGQGELHGESRAFVLTPN